MKENDPATQARILAHLVANHRTELKRVSAAEMKRDEEETSSCLSDELRKFLIAYGRTVPADTPPLPEAEARFLMLGPQLTDPVLAVRSCILLTRARLREGLLNQAGESLERAQKLLPRLEHLPTEDRERWSGLLRQLAVNLKMARGRLPALPWVLEDIHDELIVPHEDWPHMIVTQCWIAYRLGEPVAAMALAEKLRVLMGQEGSDHDDVSKLYCEAKILLHKIIQNFSAGSPRSKSATR